MSRCPECGAYAEDGCDWWTVKRERDEARQQRDRLLEAVARGGRPPYGTSSGRRIFDVANEIAKDTGYAA